MRMQVLYGVRLLIVFILLMGLIGNFFSVSDKVLLLGPGLAFLVVFFRYRKLERFFFFKCNVVRGCVWFKRVKI